LNIKGLPERLPENIENDEKALASLHELLVEIHVEDGELVCPKCKRSYPIKNGILNMVLREDEVGKKFEE
jgi:multifunctional methyltransferase subunit TRM112